MLDIENQIFDYAKDYIISHSLYEPTVIKTFPNTFPVFPIVSIEEITQDFYDETLNKNERKTKVSYEINIFSQDKTIENKKISKHEINKELTKLISEIFDVHFGMKVSIRTAPNIDASIKRTLITCTGVVDNEKLIIYRG